MVKPISLNQKAIVRFHGNVRRTGPDECWHWTAKPDKLGYGILRSGQTRYLAHRVSLFLHTGVDPMDLHVLHSCDNPTCVNPSHLRFGTHQDNMDDRTVRMRGTVGSKNPGAKLKERDILDIRELAKSIKISAIARIYEMDRGTVSRIVSRKAWKNVD